MLTPTTHAFAGPGAVLLSSIYLEALRISSGDLLLLSVHPFHPFFESGDPPKYIRSPSVGRRAFPEPLVEEVLPWTLLAEINVSA